ncbi:pyocin activator PrtN family protein [Salinivibrio sp. KP-1]|uniref:pyocin activator PrtN family protein n=1 Tax=Salinivibrio sp. KP-1 TaxID=1406902 RepID=UPI000614802D|nr:pyocin activator PrtN family protein [Salinivibrio sp. KP-1]KKA45131.1 pyocin activator protein PrtN, phage related protein [Salinivibrio sp. KP-1]
MNTQFALLAHYETTTIPLKDVCEKFFGVKKSTAEQQAKAGTFPVPTFKLRDSERSPTLIHVSDLAAYIDARYKAAKEEWTAVNTPA